MARTERFPRPIGAGTFSACAAAAALREAIINAFSTFADRTSSRAIPGVGRRGVPIFVGALPARSAPRQRFGSLREIEQRTVGPPLRVRLRTGLRHPAPRDESITQRCNRRVSRARIATGRTRNER